MAQVVSATSTLFDNYADSYREAVEGSLGFTARNLDFFTSAKAFHLKQIGGRLPRRLEDSEVLDVGCGTGAMDSLIAPIVGRLVGVDVSEGMVSAARQRNQGIDYQPYSGGELPFDDESFDMAFAICVVHHVDPDEWRRFLGEMLRVIRPGGAAVVMEHNPLNPLTRRSVSNCEFDSDAILTRPGRLKAMFNSLGAATVRHRYMLFTLMRGERAQALEHRLFSHLPLGAQYYVEARR